MASKLSQPQKQELQIVLVGRTGVGKSAAGNTILGREAFTSQVSVSSVTTKCQKKTGNFGGQSLAVIDTPGLFHTIKQKQHEILEEIITCISLAAPGPHVFLVVLQMGRFTPEEKETVEIIQTIFGKEAARYTMVLFTHGDQLKDETRSKEEIIGGNQHLSNFIKKCHGFHVFDNKDTSPSQVTELLHKINSMVEINGGSYYKNEMLQEAERAIVEEMKNLLKRNTKMTIEEARIMAEGKKTVIKKLRKLLTRGVTGAVATILEKCIIQ